MAAYANQHGDPNGLPYLSINGKTPITSKQWENMRSKFTCEAGITNVWSEPPVRGPERLKERHRCVHLNQKPLKLFELIVRISSDEGDMVWEPFGGLCSGAQIG
jgi:DNA modification methylase